MFIFRKGRSWYLKRSRIIEGVRRQCDITLQVYGGDEARGKAEKAAVKKAAEIDAENEAAKSLVRLAEATGQSLKRAKPAVVPTLAEWWADYQVAHVDGLSSADRIVGIVTAWLAMPRKASDGKPTTWGATRLDLFTQTDCKLALARRRQTKAWHGRLLSESTVRKEHGHLAAIFKQAIIDRKIQFNPFDGIEKGVDTPRDRAATNLTADNLDALLDALHETPHVQRFVRFALATGARLGGIMGLTAADVEPTFVHVSEKSRTHHDACPRCGRVGRKCRNVPLTTDAQDVLKEQLATGKLWGEAMHTDSVKTAIRRAVKRANLPPISPHDFRHALGHQWAQKGGSLKGLAKMLGHSSTRVTDRYYAHLNDADVAAEALAVLEPPAPPKKAKTRKPASKPALRLAASA